MITVVIVEDNDTIREGLALLINATEGMECPAHFSSCEKFIAQLPRLTPDLVLMDIGLPGMSGIDGIKPALEILPEALIVMLTVYEDDQHIFQSLCAGASGYLLKKTPPAQLMSFIQEAFDGGSPMSAEIARKVVTLFRRFAPAADDSAVQFTKRELDILSGLSQGSSYKMLAFELAISVDTIRYHIRNIYKKLQVHSQSEAVAKALRQRLI